MKKLILTLSLLLSFQTQAIVASSLSGGWATYAYMVGGAMTGVETFNILSGNDDGRSGVNLIIGILILDNDSKVATFPELSNDFVRDYDIGATQVNSYNRDLTALRMSVEHMGLLADQEDMTREDIEKAVDQIDRALNESFSKETMEVVETIRQHNASNL